MRNIAAEHGATLVHGTCAYIAFLAVQISLTIVLSITKHKVAGMAGSLLIYAIVWPFVGCTCGVMMEVVALGFGFATSIAQLTDVLGVQKVTNVNMILALLAFVACAATLILLMPCTTALSQCCKQRVISDDYVRQQLPSHTQFVPPPLPQLPRHLHTLTPPPQAITQPSIQWITVVSPDNHIDIAKNITQS